MHSNQTPVDANIPSARSVDELLSLEGKEFLRLAYLTLLRRQPDPDGMTHYLARLESGARKSALLYELHQSTEGQRLRRASPGSHVSGLETLLKNEQPRSLRLVPPFIGRRTNVEDTQSISALLREISRRLFTVESQMDSKFSEIQDALRDGLRPQVKEAVKNLMHRFDPDSYLEANQDVKTAGMNPFEHYMRYGLLEDRALTPDEQGRTVPTEPLPTVGNQHHLHFAARKDAAVSEYEELVFSDPPLNPAIRLVAFYLPQFHPIQENDNWWGKGFTEWTNVTRAKPFYAGHEQPKLPGELGFYDLRLAQVMRRQAELARIHGVYGFCFYVYWFAGRRLLETPLTILLDNPDIDINFCYCWANENWTRRWDGLENDVLIGQSHSPEDDFAFIADIAAAFKDRRYIRIDGRPLLVLYRPGLLPDCKQTVDRWRQWCRTNGIGEIYVAFTESFGGTDPAEFGMDASIQFPPLTNGPHREMTAECDILDENFSGKIYDYAATVENSTDYVRPSWTQYRAVMPSWDNTARKMERGFSFKGATPELYAKWLNTVAVESAQHFSSAGGSGLVFVNAWNEWAEGAYLEPDRLRGYAYLNRTREVISKLSTAVTIEEPLFNVVRRGHDIAVVVHLFYIDLFDVISKYLDTVYKGADFYFNVRSGTYDHATEKIKSRYPRAVVVSYPNHGRDVLPFLKVLQRIHGFGYKGLCKIHTKKSKHRTDGDRWRDDVLSKLLGSEATVATCLGKIDSGAGIVVPAGHLLDSSNYWGSNAEKVTRLAKGMGCPQAWIDHFVFPAGTMFWCSPKALEPLLALSLNEEDFEAEAGQVDGTTAHAVERLISLSARKAGLSIVETGSGFAWEDASSYPFAAKG